MIGTKKVACIIPARLNSTRFPGKMLALLRGKPLLQWVYERAKRIPLFDHLYIATDATQIQQVAHSFSANVFMTSPSCQSGTERLVELCHTKALSADIWINWQGDEPFIHSALIDDLLQTAHLEDADVWTLKHPITAESDIHNPHMPKVVTNAQGYALYFSRSTIPYHRDPLNNPPPTYFKHIGMYAFTQTALQKLHHLAPSELERIESLEQLRFLDHGMKIRVHKTDHHIFGIDTKEQLEKAQHLATDALYHELFLK